MAPLDQNDVIQIMKLLEGSTFDELQLEIGDLKLYVNKRRGKGGALRAVDFGSERHAAPAPSPEQPPPPPTATPEAVEAAPDDRDESGLTPIRSPMLGTFYAAPKPGAPPFVQVGQQVAESDTVCIIEVMKLFNTVKAGLRGRVARVCARDAEMVEYNQVLFLVEEESAALEQQAK